MTITPTLWKGSTQVNTTDPLFQLNAQIAPLQDGGYIVAWTDTSLTHYPNGATVVGQRYNFLGEKVGGEVRLAAFTGSLHDQQYEVAITTLSNGNIAVAFQDEDTGIDFDLFVRIYDPALNFIREDTIHAAIPWTFSPAITPPAGGRICRQRHPAD